MIESSLAGWTVLVVDDEPDNVMVTQMVLEMHGLTVYTAGGGREALRWLRDNPPPDFMLCDLSMPEVSGWEVQASLRRDPRTASLTVFALTAHAMAADRLRTQQSGFAAHLTKPIDPMTFVPELARLLQKAPHLAGRFASAGEPPKPSPSASDSTPTTAQERPNEQ